MSFSLLLNVIQFSIDEQHVMFPDGLLPWRAMVNKQILAAVRSGAVSVCELQARFGGTMVVFSQVPRMRRVLDSLAAYHVRLPIKKLVLGFDKLNDEFYHDPKGVRRLDTDKHDELCAVNDMIFHHTDVLSEVTVWSECFRNYSRFEPFIHGLAGLKCLTKLTIEMPTDDIMALKFWKVLRTMPLTELRYTGMITAELPGEPVQAMPDYFPRGLTVLKLKYYMHPLKYERENGRDRRTLSTAFADAFVAHVQTGGFAQLQTLCFHTKNTTERSLLLKTRQFDRVLHAAATLLTLNRVGIHASVMTWGQDTKMRRQRCRLQNARPDIDLLFVI